LRRLKLFYRDRINDHAAGKEGVQYPVGG
jgi:hypothetical protein